MKGFTIDFIIIGVYLAIIIGYGIYQGQKVKTSAEFFIADKRMPWWATSLAFFTLVLSTQDIVAYTETGYMRGFTAFNPYISIGGFILLFIALGAPIYYFTGVYTVPEYLSKRYNERTSLAGSVALLLFLLAILAFNIYAFAVMVEGLFGFPILSTILVLSILIAIYTSIGGVVSVISVDVLQAAFLFFGGLLIVGIGIHKVGGWNELIAWTPAENIQYTTSVGDPGYPAIGMWMGISIIVAAFYMMHQGVLQKCLAARSMNGTRLTMLIYGMVMLPLGCLFTGTPGLIARALVEKGVIPEPDTTGHTMAYLLTQIMPHGLLGLCIAGIMAAMISTTDSYINSATTVFINDIYMKLVKNKPDTHYLKLARIVTYVVAIGIPFVFVQYFMNIPYLIAAFYSITSAVVPGVLIAVICGMGTKWFKAKAATASIIASIVGTLLSIFWPATFLAPFCIGISYTDPGASWFQTVAGFVWAVVVAIIFSFLPEKKKSDIELFGLVRNHPRVDIAHDAYFYGLTKNKKGIDQLSVEDKQHYLKLNKEPYKKYWKGQVLKSE